MGDNNETITMSVSVLNKLIELNKQAKEKVSPVGGNSVQISYRNNTIEVLNEQMQLLEVFAPGKES